LLRELPPICASARVGIALRIKQRHVAGYDRRPDLLAFAVKQLQQRK
jgi:hypothetical protein